MIKRQFDFPGTDDDLLYVLYQHFSDKVEASRFVAPVIRGEHIWILDHGPATYRRRLVPTIRVIEYPVTYTSFDLVEYVDERERRWHLITHINLPRPVLGIVLELGIAVNRTLPVTLWANPLFAREACEILTVLRVIDAGEDLLSLDQETHTDCLAAGPAPGHQIGQQAPARPPAEGDEDDTPPDPDPRQDVLHRLQKKKQWTAEEWRSYFDAWYVWTRGTQPNLQEVAEHCDRSINTIEKRHASYRNRHFPPY